MNLRWAAVLVAVAGAVACSCSGGGDGARPGSSATTSTATSTSVATTTTTVPLRWSATSTGEHAVGGDYRQGLARVDDGWLFTTNNAIYRTDGAFAQIAAVAPAIPPTLAGQTYDHIGDGDVAAGRFWVPLERADKEAGQQVTARYDAGTLAFIDSFVVPQHHNAFVTVDEDGIVYSADEFSDDTLVRYEVDGPVLKPLEPLKMSRVVERIQGGDISEGAIWLSTDDAHNGLYRVDLTTGEVQDLGSLGHAPAGEGEGIDVTDLPAGLLHGVVADEKYVPMYVVDFKVSSTPA